MREEMSQHSIGGDAVACGCSHNHTIRPRQPGTASRREDLAGPASSSPTLGALQDTDTTVADAIAGSGTGSHWPKEPRWLEEEEG